jgi:hypothetical protein
MLTQAVLGFAVWLTAVSILFLPADCSHARLTFAFPATPRLSPRLPAFALWSPLPMPVTSPSCSPRHAPPISPSLTAALLAPGSPPLLQPLPQLLFFRPPPRATYLDLPGCPFPALHSAGPRFPLLEAAPPHPKRVPEVLAGGMPSTRLDLSRRPSSGPIARPGPPQAHSGGTGSPGGRVG